MVHDPRLMSCAKTVALCSGHELESMDMKIARFVGFGMAMSSLMVQGVNTFAAGEDQDPAYLCPLRNLGLEILDRRTKAVFQADLRLPPEQSPRAGDVRLPLFGIVDRQRAIDDLAPRSD